MVPPPHYPSHWGPGPYAETDKSVQLPGPYGMGSKIEKAWIQANMQSDAAKGIVGKPPHPNFL